MNSAYRLSLAALMALLATQGIKKIVPSQAIASQPPSSSIASPQQLLAQNDPIDAEEEVFREEDLETFSEEDLENADNDFLGVGEDSLLVQADESVGYITLTENSTAALEGGRIAHATFRDASTVEMTGSSHISHADLTDKASITMSDAADVSHLTLSDFSTAAISGRSDISHLNLQADAEGTIEGGTIGFINLSDRSVAHIRRLSLDGGAFIAGEVNTSGGAVTYTAGTTLHIYGRSLSFADGIISGSWADGTPFALTLIESLGNPEEAGSFEMPTSLPSEVIFHEV